MNYVFMRISLERQCQVVFIGTEFLMKHRHCRANAVLLLAAFAPAADWAETPQFTDWQTPANLQPTLNSPYEDSCVAISKNGLSLFFSSNRQTGDPNSLDRDLYVSQRTNVTSPWSDPKPLVSLNTKGSNGTYVTWESCPALSLDEHRLYFTSGRPPSLGVLDIWVSRRHDRRDDFGWESPIHIDTGDVNMPAAGSIMPTFFEDESGRVWMYFTSARPGSTAFDIYQSEVLDDGTFGPASPVAELNSAMSEYGGATVRRDGLEVIFLSNRRGTGSVDFFTATRESTAEPWSPPVFVPSLGDPALAQGRIALSFDGRELYFTSRRAPSYGAADLWVARRGKVRGK
jgi:hypothetical protein